MGTNSSIYGIQQALASHEPEFFEMAYEATQGDSFGWYQSHITVFHTLVDSISVRSLVLTKYRPNAVLLN